MVLLGNCRTDLQRKREEKTKMASEEKGTRKKREIETRVENGVTRGQPPRA